MEHRFRAFSLRRLAVSSLLLAAVILVLPLQSEAAPPANDLCSGAQVLPGAGPFPLPSTLVNLTDATLTGVELSALTNTLRVSPVSRGIWYKFRPVTNAFYTVSTCTPATSVEDTVMAIFTSANACAGPFAQVGYGDDVCGPGDAKLASATLPLLADTDYYIVVWKYGTAAPLAGQGNVQLLITRQLPPANDTCLTAQTVFLNTLVAGSTILASNNYQLSGSACFSGITHTAKTATGRDVVYTFTAEETGDYSFKVFNYQTDGDLNLVLYVGGYCPPGAGPQTVSNCLAAANRNGVSTAEEIMCLPMLGGQQVYVYVDDGGSNNIGSNFLIEINRCQREVEPNDTTTNAAPLFCGVEGSILPAGDLDYFSVGRFPAGSRLFALLDGEAASTTQFNLRVVNRTDTLEYDDDNNDVRFGTLAPNLAGTPLPGGEVFLRVNAAGAIEPYRLYAVVQPATNSAALETEPNNSITNANTAPANYYYGSLAGPAPSADIDHYRFTASDGDLVFLSLDGDPMRDNTPLNAQLELLDEFGNVLVTASDASNISNTNRTYNDFTNDFLAVFPSSPAEGLAFRAAEGIYFAKVSVGYTVLGAQQTGPSGSGDYLLSISKNGLRGQTSYNNDPVLSGVSISPAILEGGTATLNANVWDPDIGDTIALSVNWGDGLSSAVSLTTPGLNSVSLQHQYMVDLPPGMISKLYNVQVTAMDNFGATSPAGAAIVVSNAPPGDLVFTASPSPVGEGGSVAVDGSFTDPGASDVHTITIGWGDGTAAAVLHPVAGVRVFNAIHLYRDDAPTTTPFDTLTVTVTVSDDSFGSVSATAPLTVTNVPPRLLNVAITSPVFVNSNAVLTGTISDPGGLDTFILSVNWGDGSFAQNFSHPAGATAFSHNHAYATGGTNYTINLTLVDDDTGSDLASVPVQVNVNAQAPRFLNVTKLGSGNMLLQLQGTPLATYRIVTSPNLTTWAHLGSATADAAGNFTFEDTAPLPNSRFYRAVAP